jgi:hypothetical protein
MFDIFGIAGNFEINNMFDIFGGTGRWGKAGMVRFVGVGMGGRVEFAKFAVFPAAEA